MLAIPFHVHRVWPYRSKGSVMQTFHKNRVFMKKNLLTSSRINSMTLVLFASVISASKLVSVSFCSTTAKWWVSNGEASVYGQSNSHWRGTWSSRNSGRLPFMQFFENQRLLTHLFQKAIVQTRMVDIVSSRCDKQGQFFSIISKKALDFWPQHQRVGGLHHIHTMQCIVVGHCFIFSFDCGQKSK